jgi:hypothetical protein
MKKLLFLFLLMVLMVPGAAVYAADEEYVLSYKEALAMAKEHLSSLATLDESLNLMKEQQDDLKKQLREIQDAENNPYTDMLALFSPEPKQSPTVKEQLQHTIKNLDRQMDSLRLNREIIYAGTEMSLRNTLVNLANYEMDIQLMEETITLNEENVRRVTLRRQFGMASENDQRTAEQTLTQSRTNLEALLISQASEKQSLNKFLHLPLEKQVTVEWEREFIDMPDDLNEFIAMHIRNAPTIKQKQFDVDIKKANRDFNKEESRKLTLRSEYDQAQRELADAKLALEAAIRSGNQNMEQLQKRDEALHVDAEKAIDQERTVQAHLSAGLVTQYEVEQVALAIINSEVAIEKNLNQLWTLQFVLTHPFLLV